MFERKLAKKVVDVLVFSLATGMLVGSCGKADNANNAAVTPQGTIQLETIRAGMPESIFKNATISFVVDTNSAAGSGNKTQYVSRAYNAKHGQYVAQCKNDRCYEMQVLYKDNPVSKEEALATLAQIMPPDSPPESSSDNTQVEAGKSGKIAKIEKPTEFHFYGDKYMGTFTFADTAGTKVLEVNAFALEPETALTALYGKVPRYLAAKFKADKAAVAASTGDGKAATDKSDTKNQ